MGIVKEISFIKLVILFKKEDEINIRMVKSSIIISFNYRKKNNGMLIFSTVHPRRTADQSNYCGLFIHEKLE